jgi:glycosyltransferase involved in cell wall biosynthesis
MTDLNTSSKGNITPLASVVIPSYNSAGHIRRCLRAIRAQRTSVPFEVILVDSSRDGTELMVAEEFPEVRLFHFPKRKSVGEARNIGIRKARSEVVLFLDSDCLAGESWLDGMYSAVRAPGVSGVCGSIENGTPWSITGTVGFYLEFFRFLRSGDEPSAITLLLGGNSGFKKEVFELESYNPQSVADDFIFSWKLAKKGQSLLFLPSIPVRHLNKTGIWRVLEYQYKLGIGAHSFRREISPRIIRFLERLPPLVFLLPPGVMVWIGGTVLRRQGLLEFIKFAVLLPLLLAANGFWAAGLYRELRTAGSRGKADSR